MTNADAKQNLKVQRGANPESIEGASPEYLEFFEDIEQQVLSSLERENFKAIPLRLELRFIQNIFFTMESLILAQDER